MPIANAIELFKQVGVENAKKNSKVSGIDLNTLKQIADHFGMVKSLGKNKLCDQIHQKILNIEALKNKGQQQHLPAGASAPPKATFRRDFNTLPHLLNVLTTYPAGLLRSRDQATWKDLQNKTINAGNPMPLKTLITMKILVED